MTKTLVGAPDPFVYGDTVMFEGAEAKVFDTCDNGDILVTDEQDHLHRVHPSNVVRS